ncbi:MAG: histidine phosphatase family protein [Oscillospiraceae bacterium]|nr:histidine phosphatase family protein [Oscillospiraceae bacterium]
MDLYLIRHGESFRSLPEYYNYERQVMDPPLTEKGIEQAKLLSQRCKKLQLDVILTSDLSRAQQTANILSELCRSKVICDKALREIDMGDLYLKSWDLFPDTYSKWISHDEDIAYPNGENGEAVWQRCKIIIQPLIKKYNKVAIVCHGGTIRSIICGLLNISQEKRFYLGLPPENCSISIIKYNEKDEKYYLHVFNDHSHILNY